MSNFIYILVLIYVCVIVRSFTLPGECDSEQFFDPGSMACQNCPANVSMVTSADGFGCTCEDNSVPAGPARCRPCNATEVVSEDGSACVPRRCQVSAGKIVCRKCPNDYISATQGFDGSPLKEVLCVKCARGFKARDNKCVKCEACICNKNELVVRGTCVPKRYVNDRPRYTESNLHPTTLLEIVKQEYLCTKNDLRSCRTLARMCVKSFYMTDTAGPCRLWLQPQLVSHRGLPQLTIPTSNSNTQAEEIDLPSGQNAVVIVMTVHTGDGGLKLLRIGDNISPCLPPVHIRIGDDITRECHMNMSKPDMNAADVYELYVYFNGEFKPIPLSILKATYSHTDYPQQNEWKNSKQHLYIPFDISAALYKGAWPSGKFKKFFALHSTLSTTANVSDVIYLKSFTLLNRIERKEHNAGSLHLQLSVVLQYATRSPLSDTVITTLKVIHEMPLAGVLRGLEIWGGIVGTLLTLYAVVQWRGVVRRGGLQVAAISLLAGAVADALYFTALFSTVHALSAEAGTLGMSLPLSEAEESVIEAFVYTVVSMKVLKVLWVNWCQCHCDIFFITWSEYNPPLKEELPYERTDHWKAVWLAKEWSCMQTKRRASPALTLTLTLIVLHVIAPWQSYLPKSQGYNWASGMVAWWAAYCAVVLARCICDKMFGSPTDTLPKVCKAVGLSLLVFQEDLYAHYVHGRYEGAPDAKPMAGPLAKCRVVCAPQLRIVYKKLSTPDYGNLGNSEPNRILLSRFLAAFFERALDGLNWVASERTILERLIDVELSAREGGATSALLYDPDTCTPSCFAVTWWGEEWTLATFDAMLFGCVLLATEQPLLASLATLVTWQIMKLSRTWLGNRNIREKIEVEI